MSDDRKEIRLQTDPPLGWITLNRPNALNALSPSLVKELATALDQLDEDREVRAVVITGGEKVFAAGADIKRLAGAGPFDPIHPERWKDVARIRRFAKPLIAAVSGFALGGGFELAMCADIVIASETARFGQPEINIGIIPGGGGTQILTRTAGKYRAMEIILTGRALSAQEACAWGLVNSVVPTGVLLAEAERVARRIAALPEKALNLGKEMLSGCVNSSLEQGLQAEAQAFQLLFSDAEQKERMTALTQKRSFTAGTD